MIGIVWVQLSMKVFYVLKRHGFDLNRQRGSQHGSVRGNDDKDEEKVANGQETCRKGPGVKE